MNPAALPAGTPAPLLIDRATIAAHLDHAAAVAAVRDSLIAYSAGQVQQPPVVHLDFPAAQGDCHVKCAHLAGMPVFTVKIAAGFYGNADRGLPSTNGMMIAVSASTGAIVALLFDEGLLTDWRTGHAGALATQLCWPEGADRLGILGTGTQARMQLQALRLLMPDRPLSVTVWGRTPDRARRFAAEMAAPGLRFAIADSPADLCAGSQVIITTTPTTEPLLRAEWIAPGTHVTAVGADLPGKQELDSALVARADILLADSRAQCLDHGECAHAVASGLIAADKIREIGTLLQAGTLPRKPTDISIADLTGLGAEDAAICAAVLARIAPQAR